MTGERIALIGFVAYLLVGIVSFGHAAAQAQIKDDQCDLIALHDPKKYCIHDAEMSGLGAAFIWPFYWSWEYWS